MRFRNFNTKSEKAYNDFNDKLVSVCGRRDFTLFTIGRIDSLDVYGVVINPKASKTICYTAGIHGNEIAGPFAVLNFLDEVIVPRNTKVLAIPLLNPHGFVQGTRLAGRVNLNRQFNKSDPPKREAGFLQKVMEQHSVQFLHSIHEDCGADGFYLYYQSQKIKQKCKKILEVAKEHIKIDTRSVIYGDKVESPGLIFVDEKSAKIAKNAKSFEGWMFERGTDYICTEGPMNISAKKRVRCIATVMRFVIENF
jgi:hypothetical protein